MSVASTILEQLGGRRFIAMTGAKHFMDDGDKLIFMLPHAKDGINKVVITLTPLDDYTLTFYRVRAGAFKQVSEATGIYNDQLQEVFRNHTGLATHL